MSRPLKLIISILAIALGLAHQFVPAANVDATTLVLIVAAILPWTLQHLRGFEIPGVVKIDFLDTKAATDKVTQTVIKPSAGQLRIPSRPPIIKSRPTNDFVAGLRAIYEHDPNLAFVGFRIEVEKRIRELARMHGLADERDSIQRLIQALTKRNVIQPEAGSGLMELVALGNRAAHGAAVSSDAGSWLLDVGPSILLQLDNLIDNNSSGAE
jgi:hypothetical protein